MLTNYTKLPVTLVRWNPSCALAPIDMEWMPAVDIFETNDSEFVVKAELPEMKREDIDVTFENGVLTLTGERKAESEENSGTYHRNERASGRFSRSFTLPPTVDANRIDAAYKDGVLTIRLPQREEAKLRKITVRN
jgi:HSP20 family protein